MHVPVLLQEVLEYLDVQPRRDYIDATISEGGYAKEILKRNRPNGKLLGIDWDEEAIDYLKKEIRTWPDSGRLVLEKGNFSEIRQLARQNDFKLVNGIVFDLGLSTRLIESSGRGFSYLANEPLFMRYELGITNQENEQKLTARIIVNQWSERDLERIFREYGEERRARRIAKAIIVSRRKKLIKTTGELVQAIERVTRSIKTKARIFQALRIAVNDELENLKRGLKGAWEILKPGGRIVVISFHSLEDRIVKIFFRNLAKEKEAELLTKKPILPTQSEIKANPKSRSAKLRAILKIENHES